MAIYKPGLDYVWCLDISTYYQQEMGLIWLVPISSHGCSKRNKLHHSCGSLDIGGSGGAQI